MTTVTFKLDESEARRLRQAAKRARLTVSEYVRRRLRAPEPEVEPLSLVKCSATGALIFGRSGQLPPLTTESVNEMLGEFP